MAVSEQVAHGLIPRRLDSFYGSDVNGSCTSVVGDRTSCNDTSVLNDGNISVLSGVSAINDSVWAAQLFISVRAEGGRIIISFELKTATMTVWSWQCSTVLSWRSMHLQSMSISIPHLEQEELIAVMVL